MPSASCNSWIFYLSAAINPSILHREHCSWSTETGGQLKGAEIHPFIQTSSAGRPGSLEDEPTIPFNTPYTGKRMSSSADLTTTSTSPNNQARKRTICKRCDRPKETTCICPALPDMPIVLEKCHCVVLQHPQEAKRKNRSLPFVQLCLSSSSLSVTIGKRFGSQTDPRVKDRIQSKDSCTWLLFPGKNSIPLSKALESLSEQDYKKVTLIVLDATWEYAKQMNNANESTHQYPAHLQRVKLDPNEIPNFKPRRFSIRSPPAKDYLSTAESLSFCVSMIEKRPDIYETIMKPLDLMVSQWESFANRKQNDIIENEEIQSSQNTL